MPRRSPRGVVRGALAGLALLAAPAAARAEPAPSTAAEPAEPDSAAKLAAAVQTAAAGSPRKYHASLAKLLSEHADSPEALAAALEFVARSRRIWYRSGRGDLHLDDLSLVTGSAVYRRPDAAELRRSIAALQAEYAPWAAGMRHLEDGKRGVEGGFLRCGEAFAALSLRLHRDDARTPFVLWHAGLCLEAASHWPEAAAAYTRLVTEYPHHELHRNALRNLVYGHFAAAEYEPGARWAEYYAKHYFKDIHTPDFLRDAVIARQGLGQPERALVLLGRLGAMYERSNPELAAKYFWRRRELLPEAAQRDHAEAYLERHGKRGGLDRRLVAEARVGELTWQRACAEGQMNGLCISTREPAAPRTCAEPGTRRLVVYARAADDAELARRFFASVTHLARGRVPIPEDDVERLTSFSDAVGLASVYEVDREFEPLLADLARLAAVPADDPALELPGLLARVERTAPALERRYAALTSDSDVAVIMAAARSGQIADLWADAELLREVPRALGEAAARAHCERERRRVAPLRTRAREAYAQCLARSQATANFTEYSRLCEAALVRLDPARVPPLAELFGADTSAPSVPKRVGVILEAPTEPPAPTPEPAAGPVAHPTLGPPDNDGDGVRDADDRCPDVPEDRDGRDDRDGCPDVDDDGDAIPDAHQWQGERWSSCDVRLEPTGPRDCRAQPEDRDGVADHDGCPEAATTCTTARFVPLVVAAGPLRIEPDERSSLVDVAAHLRARPTDTIVVTAHLALKGRDGGKRAALAVAAAVRDELVRLGVPAGRVRIVGLADAAPPEHRHTMLVGPRVELTAVGDCPEPAAPLPMLCL